MKLICSYGFAIVRTAKPDLSIFEVLNQFAIMFFIQVPSPDYPGFIDVGAVVNPFVMNRFVIVVVDIADQDKMLTGLISKKVLY